MFYSDSKNTRTLVIHKDNLPWSFQLARRPLARARGSRSQLRFREANNPPVQVIHTTSSFQYTQFEHKLLRPYTQRSRKTHRNRSSGISREERLRCKELDSMRAVLPGKPRAKLQAVCTGCWDGRRLIV